MWVATIRVRGENADETHEYALDGPSMKMGFKCPCVPQPYEGFPIPFSRSELVVDPANPHASHRCPQCGLEFSVALNEEVPAQAE